MGKRITADEFAERINILFDGKLNIIKDTFKGMKHKVSVRCNVHNCVFEVNAYSLSIKETNCPECGKDIRHKNTITQWSKMLKRFREKWGERFDYDESTYNGYKSEMKIICKECGSEFWIKPKHHLKYNNGGCPICHLTVKETCYICGETIIVDRRQRGRKHLMCEKCRKIVASERALFHKRNNFGVYSMRLKEVQLLDKTYIKISYIDASNLYYENKISLEQIKEHFPNLISICIICGKEFVRKIVKTSMTISKSNTCSEDCAKELRSKRSKESIIKQKEKGIFKGWMSRNISSYAEKYWMKVLDNLNIKYIREYRFVKYFLDFRIEIGDIILDLEIDGKQHTYEDRRLHDKERDQFLTENGFTVYRIPWNNISTDKGHQQMQDKINKFLEFYNSLKEQQNIK